MAIFHSKVSHYQRATGGCSRSQDYRLDGEVLLPYDLKASGAHASMLQKIGVLTAEEPDLNWVILGGQGLQLADGWLRDPRYMNKRGFQH